MGLLQWCNLWKTVCPGKTDKLEYAANADCALLGVSKLLIVFSEITDEPYFQAYPVWNDDLYFQWK